MKILFCASECAPLVKVGGLGDVIGALPKALRSLGLDVCVVLPFYKDISGLDTIRRETFGVRFNDVEEEVTVYEAKLPDSEVPVFLLKNEKYLSNGGVYFDKSAFASSQDEIARFAFFSKAVAEFCDYIKPTVVHCHDWHTGLVPFFLKNSHTPTVFTIHNLANQGFSSLNITKSLGLINSRDRVLDWDAADSNLDLMLQGIVRSDIVTTVSENYAKEILTPEFGEGLQDVLNAREANLVGITNGIDVTTYNPGTDSAIPVHFDTEIFVEGKLKNKIALQKELGLTPDPKKLLIGLVSRLTFQKGIDLVLNSLNEIMKHNGQLVILGQGEGPIEEKLAAENDRLGLTGNYKAILKFDENLARRIYAASDLFLVPSRFEPCGLTQMVAMRYGSLPIVRAVGGLVDTVNDNDTGFVFHDFSPKALNEALDRAYKTFLNPYSWQKMVTNVMSADWSWELSAQKYVAVYRRAMGIKENKGDMGDKGNATVETQHAASDVDRVADTGQTSGRGQGGVFRFDKKKELWTIIAPSRKSRPVSVSNNSVETLHATSLRAVNEPLDPFAPGNESLTPPEVFRIGSGAPDQPGWRVRVTPNKFPITDFHEVIIHNPDLRDWADFTLPEALDVLKAYKNRFEYYSSQRADFYPHLYCNHGVTAGASLAHPHSQLVVFDRLPSGVAEEVNSAANYLQDVGECVYCRLIANEAVFTERLVYEDQYFMVVTPFASAWPYELLLLPKRHSCDFASIDSKESQSLAQALILACGVIKRQFNDAGYNFWIHSLPMYGDYGKNKNSYHWHLELVPRLKVLAGIELGAGIMVDDKASPEEAAKFYRENLHAN